MIKAFLNFIKNYSILSNIKSVQNSNIFVGRWLISRNSDYNQKSINIIIDRNNNDHCGTCHSHLK
jgi:hypothetical protein